MMGLLVSRSAFGRWFFGDIPLDTHYVFHVPNGTVTNQFNIDME